LPGDRTEQGKAEAQARTVEPYMVTGTRDMRFGEILVVKADGIEVYNTTGLNDCPAQLWSRLDPATLAREFGALAVQKNGPHYWMMDSQTVSFGEEISFGGLEARWAATLDPALVQKAAQGTAPYKVFTPKKTQKMVYSKGKPVYELLDPDGNIYNNFVTGAGQNRSGYANPRFDTLLDAARILTTPEHRRRAYADALAIMNEDLPYLFLYWPKEYKVMNPKLQGYVHNSDGMMRLRHVWMNP